MLADPYSFPIPDFLRLCNAQVPGAHRDRRHGVGGRGPGRQPARARRPDHDERRGRGACAPTTCRSARSCRRAAGRSARRSRSRAPSATSRTSSPGNRRWHRLQEIVQAATDEDRELMRDGLHLGLVVDEHRLDFQRGDFLVRNVLGADQSTGSLAIGEQVDVGQTVQFQVRDARRRRRGPALRCSPACRGDGRAAVHVQRPGHAPVRRARPRRRGRRGAARTGAARRRVLRGRDRPDRRPQLPARLHRQRRRLRLTRALAATSGVASRPLGMRPIRVRLDGRELD